MKFALKLAAGIALGLTVVLVGCGALFAASEQEYIESRGDGITQEQFDQFSVGDTSADVKAELGEPADKTVDQIEGLGTTTCLMYDGADEFLDTYQFCFEKGRLTTKASF